jgi:hypothetical protein
MNRQAPAFSQRKQAEQVVQIGVGQKHAGNRRVPHRFGPRVKFGELLKLRRNIGRSINQEPATLGIAKRYAGLSSGRKGALSGCPAIRAGAIPLGEPSSRSRS